MSNYKWKLSMPLAPKTQIDRYEIRSLLGAGGMDPTRLQHSTPGVILGTAGYMSGTGAGQNERDRPSCRHLFVWLHSV